MNKIIKINHLNTGFWLVPSFLNMFAAKRSKTAIKVAQTFEDLIMKNDLLNAEAIININGDRNFINFNKAQKIKNIKFELNNQIIKKVETSEKDLKFYDWNIVDNLIIRLDEKALYKIWLGYIPFYSIKWYKDLYKNSAKHSDNEVVYYHWRKSGFQQFKIKNEKASEH